MIELDEFTKEELIDMVKVLQKDCRHLNAQLAIAEMALSGIRNCYISEIDELKNKLYNKNDEENGNL